MTNKQLKDFTVFPKHIGEWSGKWIRMDADGKETQRFEAIIAQEIIDNQWVQKITYKYSDGRTEVSNFIGKVISDSEIELESPNVSAWQNYQTIAREDGDSIIIFSLREKTTGKLFAIELINLVNNNYRCRTSQSFTPDGKLKGLMLVVEERIS